MLIDSRILIPTGLCGRPAVDPYEAVILNTVPSRACFCVVWTLGMPSTWSYSSPHPTVFANSTVGIHAHKCPPWSAWGSCIFSRVLCPVHGRSSFGYARDDLPRPCRDHGDGRFPYTEVDILFRFGLMRDFLSRPQKMLLACAKRQN